MVRTRLKILILLLTLPVSRRRARVRRVHIARAVLYPFAMLLIPVFIRAVGRVFISFDTPTAWGGLGQWGDRAMALYGIAGFCFQIWVFWVQLWWLCALWLGWKLEKAGWVWFLLVIAVALATILAVLSVMIALAMAA